VSTILRLTTNVDVYVAKIAEGNTLTTADHISEVRGAKPYPIPLFVW
jgi:hypothetical protein